MPPNQRAHLDDLLTPEQTSDYLNVPKATLANWRYRGTGPKFAKVGGHHVRYLASDLAEWLTNQTRQQSER